MAVRFEGVDVESHDVTRVRKMHAILSEVMSRRRVGAVGEVT